MWIPYLNNILDVNLFPYFLFICGFTHASIIYIDFTHISASNAQITSHIEYLVQTY